MNATLGRTRRSSRARQEWQVVAEASSVAEFEQIVPAVQSFPEGSLGQVRIRGFGLGVLGDLAGAERIWKKFFNRAGLEIIDVSGEGFSTVVSRVHQPRGPGSE